MQCDVNVQVKACKLGEKKELFTRMAKLHFSLLFSDNITQRLRQRQRLPPEEEEEGERNDSSGHLLSAFSHRLSCRPIVVVVVAESVGEQLLNGSHRQVESSVSHRTTVSSLFSSSSGRGLHYSVPLRSY